MSYSEWNEVKLSDIAQYVSDKIETSMINKDNYISTENMLPNKGGVTIATNLPNTKKVNSSLKGDILISNIRPYFKKIWYCDYPCGVSTDVLIIRTKDNRIYNKFLYYFLSQDKFFDFMVGTSKGTKMPRGDKNAIMSYQFKLPPLKEQKLIAKLFELIDEKIKLNNEMNKTLEEIAQSIFKHWFVDFEFPNENGEPYKSSGGKFVESELGMIPEGWKIINLGEIINISSGKRPKSKQDNSKEEYIYPLIGASSIMGYVNEFLYNEPILIIGRVGTHGIVQRYNEKCWPSDNTLVIKTEFYNFVYQILKLIDYTALNRGSTQPLITQTDIKNYQILLSDKNILDLYESITKSLFEKIDSNNQENKKLTKIRDYLLPKLMSGEIRIPEAEEAVESCLQKSN